MAGKIYINHGAFAGWAGKVDGANTNLLDELHKIQNLIKSLEGEWESDSCVTIREKIQGMEPRFQQYYEIVDNYAKFIRNTAQTYQATEASNNANANQFI